MFDIYIIGLYILMNSMKYFSSNIFSTIYKKLILVNNSSLIFVFLKATYPGAVSK